MVGSLQWGRQSARVYDDIKRRLNAYELPPGKPISPEVVADTLDVRVAPARRACRHLVEEGWAIGADKHQFLAWHPDENIRIGLYKTTEDLLLSALDVVDVASPASETRRIAIRRVYEKLLAQEPGDNDIAICTAELFYAIIAVFDKECIKNLMRTSNETLHYLRILENRHLPDVAGDLTTMCELALTLRHTELKQLIRDYHRRRCEWLPGLVHLVADNTTR